MTPSLRALLRPVINQAERLGECYQELLAQRPKRPVAAALSQAQVEFQQLVAMLARPDVQKELDPFFAAGIGGAATVSTDLSPGAPTRNILLADEHAEIGRFDPSIPVSIDISTLLEIFDEDPGAYPGFVKNTNELITALTSIHGWVVSAARVGRRRVVAAALPVPPVPIRRQHRKARIHKTRVRRRASENLLPASEGVRLFAVNVGANTKSQSVSYLLGGSSVLRGTTFSI